MDPETRSRVVYTVCLVIAASLLTCYAAFFVLYGLHHFIGFEGSALNGAFQLLNPLRRLEAGQVVGRDFQFFHGPLIPLMHYPLYTIFGGGFFGSEMSRWLLSPILFFVSSFAFLYAWYQQAAKRQRLILSVASLTTLVAVTYIAAEIITPSNSLLGVRTTFPILVGAALCMTRLKKYRILSWHSAQFTLYELVLYLLIAASLASGTEQGIAVACAYFTLTLVTSFRRRQSQSVIRKVLSALGIACIHALGIALTLLCLLSVISFGHPVNIIRYAFAEVPGDQFWYFGGEPQGFLTYSNLLRNLTLPYMLSVYAWVSLCAGLIFTAARVGILSSNQKRVILYLAVYALLTNSTMLGYFYPTQAYPSVRVLVMLAVCLAVLLIVRRGHVKQPRQAWLKRALVTLVIAGVVIGTVHMLQFTKTYNTFSLISRVLHVSRDDTSSLLGPTWLETTATAESVIRSGNQDPQPMLWSTYSSIIEMDMGQMHPSSQGHDYIIHALGSQRRNHYEQDFKATQPNYALTIRPSYSIFEEWLWSRHWGFYKQLVTDYEIVARTKPYFLWRKASQPTSINASSQPLEVTNDKLILPDNSSNKYRLIEVTVEYRPDGLSNKLPLLKKLPRYLLHPIGTRNTQAISLPPYATSWTFPIILQPKTVQTTQPYLQVSAQGLIPKSHLSIQKASYVDIPTKDANLVEFIEKYQATLPQ